jgi:hypothetical protein
MCTTRKSKEGRNAMPISTVFTPFQLRTRVPTCCHAYFLTGWTQIANESMTLQNYTLQVSGSSLTLMDEAFILFLSH